MKKILLPLVAGIAMAGAFTGCNDGSWSVSGSVYGTGGGAKMAVEAYNAGHWYVLDSVKIGRNGSFSYRGSEPMPSADILRLTLPGSGSVYFPVADGDKVVVTADASDFATRHTLGGTELARTVSVIDSVAAATKDPAVLQRTLASFVTTDTTGIVAYYTVGKSVGNVQIFNPTESFGNRVYGAAAQVYSHYRPDDPKGHALRKAYFEGRLAMGKFVPVEQEETVIEVPEAGIIDIVRYDNTGSEQRLSDIAAKGGVVLLSFTNYDMPASPAYNKILNDLYELYKDRGLEIYQIAYDSNEVTWKEAARNLPWITVWNSPHDGVSTLAAYNVGVLPLTYVINRKGELSERVVEPTRLPGIVARHF